MTHTHTHTRPHNCLRQIFVTGTPWTLTLTSADTQSPSLRKHSNTHRRDSSCPCSLSRPLPGSRRSVSEVVCWCVRRLSRSMAGSLDSACVSDGCPIREAFALNSVWPIRKDRTSEKHFLARELAQELRSLDCWFHLSPPPLPALSRVRRFLHSA